MKILTLFALVLTLIAGCSNPKPIVKSLITETEITGAFGFTLGERNHEITTSPLSDWWTIKDCRGVSGCYSCTLGYEAKPNLDSSMFQKYKVTKHPFNQTITQITGESRYWHTNTPSGESREYAEQMEKYILDILETKYGKPIKGKYGDGYDVKYVNKNFNVIKFESWYMKNIEGDYYTGHWITFTDESLTTEAHRCMRELEEGRKISEGRSRKNLIKSSKITDDF